MEIGGVIDRVLKDRLQIIAFIFKQSLTFMWLSFTNDGFDEKF